MITVTWSTNRPTVYTRRNLKGVTWHVVKEWYILSRARVTSVPIGTRAVSRLLLHPSLAMTRVMSMVTFPRPLSRRFRPLCRMNPPRAKTSYQTSSRFLFHKNVGAFATTTSRASLQAIKHHQGFSSPQEHGRLRHHNISPFPSFTFVDAQVAHKCVSPPPISHGGE